VDIRKIKKRLIILSRLTTLIGLFQQFKCKLSELRCELSKIYLPQVGSLDELTYFLTYLYLFSNKCAKYQLSNFLVFLMDTAKIRYRPRPYTVRLTALLIALCQSGAGYDRNLGVN
jgi:hypothetical protein